MAWQSFPGGFKKIEPIPSRVTHEYIQYLYAGCIQLSLHTCIQHTQKMAVCAYKHYYAGSCIHTRPRFFRRFHKGFLHFAYIFKRNSGYFDEISVMGVPESQEISFDTECRQHVSESMCKACVSHQACSCQKKIEL